MYDCLKPDRMDLLRVISNPTYQYFLLSVFTHSIHGVFQFEL